FRRVLFRSLSRAALWHPERRGSGAGGELLGKEIGVPALLALDEVHGAYGPSRVLHGVSLEARAGEVVSLLGRNGAGKSTTLKAIMSLVEVTSGAVRFDGRDITRAPTHEISRLGVGYVPEDRRIFGDLTVE